MLRRASPADKAAGQQACSPHTRGWTEHGEQHQRRGGLLPAHAGMDPGTSRSPCAPSAAPRLRGAEPTGSGGSRAPDTPQGSPSGPPHASGVALSSRVPPLSCANTVGTTGFEPATP
ncbi:hypothetical protein D7M15_27125 [Streptomyces sp. Z26]|nr:hypothetical protein D7M15_27125 [Streptomyces sp. Z26]